MPKKTVTPLRYPGGKAKLKQYTTKLIRQNELAGCTYYEAFAGGAGLAMELLKDEIVSNVVLNDIDKSVYALWHSMLNNSEKLIELIKTTPITMQSWTIQKSIQDKKEDAGLLELGFSTLFLNRTNRSGILLAGPIGGKMQSGNYKLDCRFKKKDIIERIQWIASNSDHISFYNLDALDFIDIVINQNTDDKAFIFFDPPYFVKGPGLYLNSYSKNDHTNLAKKICTIEKPWIVTYDNETFISSLYNEFNQTTYNLNYSANKAQIGSEIIIFSSALVYDNIEHAH